ncbi:MAG: HAMP domain-containing protein [Alphaproteobacteria bacterium]|nr:HAMP domain-containing protein [Alphaproteobacteria bacterium]
MREAVAALSQIPRLSWPRLPIALPGRLGGLDRLPIGARLGLLAVLAAVVAVAVGGTYWAGERHVDAALVRQDGYRQLNDLAGDVRARAAALHNHQEAFLRELKPDHAAAFAKDSQLIDQALALMSQRTATDGLTLAVGELKEGFAALSAGFAKVETLTRTLGLTDSSGLKGQLADSVKAVEDELRMWPNAGPLMPTMLHLRLAEKNFMLYGGQAYLGQHRKYAAQFDFELDASALPASTRGELRTLMNQYSADMQAFAETALAQAAEIEALRRRFQALQPILQSVFLNARDGMSAAITEQEGQRAGTTRLVAIIGVAAVGLFVLAVLVLAQSVTRPLKQIERAMKRLAGGDHRVAVPGIERKDEIGDMAKAVAVFKDNAVAMVSLREQQDEVRRQAEAAARDRQHVLADRFEHAVKSVADGVGTQAVAIKDIAQRMAQGGGDGQGSGSLAVAEAAERSRHSVASVARATEELAASVATIRQRAASSSGVAREAVEDLGRATRQVEGLAGLASDIDRVVGLIGDIAQRTNMLALNAAIEAQRAGESGRSFAVVAGEVKQLAVQTSDATREIADRLSAIQAATGDTVAAIGDVGDTVRRMDQIAREVAQAAEHQAIVTGKIERCVEEVASESRIVSDGVVTVTRSAVRYCGSAVRVIWAADDLARPAAGLRHEVDSFLQTVRAG